MTSNNLFHVCTAYILISKINKKYAQPIANTLNRHVTHIEDELIMWQEEPRKPKGTEEHATGLLIGEWSRPFCSWPWVGRLMGPKPMAGEDQIGFSPDDRKTEMNSNINTRTVKYSHTKSFFLSRMHCKFIYVLSVLLGLGIGPCYF